ncbi:MAG: hypothetical protein HYT15_01100 [Candidatus Magasanikbacteria bacterium]|nr:hypothetical protein [Candidatus Magasanikbacteria bacterium]
MQKAIKNNFIIGAFFVLSLLFLPKPTAAAPLANLGFQTSAASTAEGNVNMVNFVLDNNSFSLGDLTVNYTISGTASADDYAFAGVSGSGSVQISQGGIMLAPLELFDDGGLEGNETVIITITSIVSSNGSEVGVDQNKKVFTQTIVDNNNPPAVSFEFFAFAAQENIPATVKVNLSHTSNFNVTFQWRLNPASTTASAMPVTIGGNTFPADFTNGPSGWVTTTIPSGQTFVIIDLGVQEDNLFEDVEYIRIDLGGNLKNAVYGSWTSHLYQISDNDLPTVSFQAGSSSGQESLASPSFSVVLSNPSKFDTGVEIVSAAGGTAQKGDLSAAGNDWNLPSGMFTVPAGQTSANFSISVKDDSEQETNETAVLYMESTQGATFGQYRTLTYTIMDNDVPGSGSGSGGGGGSGSGSGTGGSMPGPSCPVLNVGDMVKVINKPAIYVVNRLSKIMYFPSGDEFKSWNQNESYGGYKTIDQACFDSLPAPTAYPGGINFRPGSYVIKKDTSSQLYAVLPNNTIAKISSAEATALYGANYKVMIVKSVFWPNYVTMVADISTKAHAGMLVKKDNKTWYVDGANLREVTSAGMTANRFKNAFVRTVPSSYLSPFGTGALIDGEVADIANRTQL